MILRSLGAMANWASEQAQRACGLIRSKTRGDLLHKVFAIAGHSGAGKTTLIQAMLSVLAQWNVTTSVIKQTHHDFALEPPGKDSARLRASGAHEVMLSSPYRYAIVRELHEHRPLPLMDQLDRLAACDLVLIEGFHADSVPRLEVYRPSLGRAVRCEHDPHLIALASDVPAVDGYTVWPLNAPQEIARRICEHLGIALDPARGAGG